MTDLDAMLTWLRQQVESDKARAEAAAWTNEATLWRVSHSTKPHERPWVILDGLDDGVAIVAAESSDVEGIAHHIAANDPRDVIAGCDAKLEIIERYEKALDNSRAHPHDLASSGALLALHWVIKRLARRYRHRDGYDESWTA